MSRWNDNRKHHIMYNVTVGKFGEPFIMSPEFTLPKTCILFELVKCTPKKVIIWTKDRKKGER